MPAKKLDQTGFSLVYIILIVVLVVGLLGFGGWFLYLDQQQKKEARQAAISTVDRNNPFIRAYGDNCVDSPINRFTAAPVATDQIRYIEPVGKVAGRQVLPASYASIVPLNPNAAANSYNLVMPGNGKVVNVEKQANGNYQIVSSYNCRFYTVFSNVPQLTSSLAQQVGELPAGEAKTLDVALEAGQPIGSFGNQPVTWVMVDAKTTPEGVLVPSQYDEQPWLAHAIDPFSVYTLAARQQLQAKSLRSVEPIGGKADYSKESFLSGNWFKSGTGGFVNTGEQPWVNYLSLAPNYIDPSTTIVSIGNWEGQPRQFAVKGQADPSTIDEARSPVKYELTELTYLKPDGSTWNPTVDGFVKGITVSQQNPVIGTIMFEVQENNRIRLQRFPGKIASQVTTFEANAELYER